MIIQWYVRLIGWSSSPVAPRYQVLSDPKRRQDYDSRGRCQEGFIDAKVRLTRRLMSWIFHGFSWQKPRDFMGFHGFWCLECGNDLGNTMNSWWDMVTLMMNLVNDSCNPMANGECFIIRAVVAICWDHAIPYITAWKFACKTNSCDEYSTRVFETWLSGNATVGMKWWCHNKIIGVVVAAWKWCWFVSPHPHKKWLVQLSLTIIKHC